VIRTVLGEYWLAASWMATSVVANTTATNARVAAAMAPAKVAARDPLSAVGAPQRFGLHGERFHDPRVFHPCRMIGDDPECS
jgi:hypothetical protein